MREDGKVRKVSIFNPLTTDFSYEWLDDFNKKHILTIPAMQIKQFNESQGRFVAKHLADCVLNERGTKTNTEDELKKILKIIYVDV